MEVMARPASPPPPPHCFRFDTPAASPYATAPSSPRGRLGLATAASPFLTAPPSPDPFDAALTASQPETPRLTRAKPFDLFQHFSSAPASPRRAAAIYAHFAEANHREGGEEEEEDDYNDEFQPRASYAANASSVPFDWEERPGTPKAGLAGGGGGAAVWDDTEFEFVTVVDKAAPEEKLTTADELFEKGRIRPLKAPLPKTADEVSDKGKIRQLKPPPGLLDGGSVASSSPRSPMARGGGGMWSPRRRRRVSSGVDFDPFAAALLEATKAPSPSPLGGKEANGVEAKKSDDPFATRPASKSAGWRRWRLSDLFLFRSSSEHGRVSRDPIFKTSPAKQPELPVKKAQPTTTGKANGKPDDVIKPRKHAGDKNAAAAAEGILGSVRLSPLQRLARGFRGSSWYHGHGMAKLGTKG